ncbi:Ap1m1 [Symbiodinium sp. KB8]|nr:Ap1m1 [Symbiodinium sp. KB8]
MWSAIFLLDMKGKILISRNYRGDVSRLAALRRPTRSRFRVCWRQRWHAGISEQIAAPPARPAAGGEGARFSRMVQESDAADLKPVFTIEGITYAFIAHRNVYMLAVTRHNCNVTMALYFLHCLRNVLCTYLGELEEESIRDNFVIIYELLDETMDFGYPQITDAAVSSRLAPLPCACRRGSTRMCPRRDSRCLGQAPLACASLPLAATPALVQILMKYIRTDAHKLASKRGGGAAAAIAPPDAVTNAVSWRDEGIVHKRNEVFLDVVEKGEQRSPNANSPICPACLPAFLPAVHMLISGSGAVLSSAIEGAVEMRTFLTGMPDLKLGLNDRAMLEAAGKASRGKSVELEDVKFHQCVRLTDYERDKTISFVPPDGAFTLMRYRVSTPLRPVIETRATVTKHSRSRLEYSVTAKARFKTRSTATNVEIIIPVPADVDSPVFQAVAGHKVTYVPEINCFKWVIKAMPGGATVRMRAQFGLPSVEADEDDEEGWRKPISVRFEIPYFTVSGLGVRYLRVLEKSGYSAQPWVRYITRNGDYQIRMT